MSVEEDVGFVVFEVRRSFGTIGEVSVTVATNEDTALAPSGMWREKVLHFNVRKVQSNA